MMEVEASSIDSKMDDEAVTLMVSYFVNSSNERKMDRTKIEGHSGEGFDVPCPLSSTGHKVGQEMVDQ